MAAPEPRVAVAVHGRYHGFDLACGLARQGALVQVATTYPAFAARRFLPPPIRLRTAPWLEAWRRAAGRFPLVPTADPGISRGFGRFAARTLPRGANLLVGWSSATLEAIAPARAMGMRVIVERGSTHILHQQRVLEEAYARHSLAAPPVPAAIVERELAEYDAADAIMTPSRFAADTFAAQGIAADKVLVNPLGVDAAAFAAAPRDDGGLPVVLFVGGVGPRKGAPTLLRAFAPLAGRARLRLVGPVEPGMDRVLEAAPRDGVDVAGAVASARMASVYAGADIFCLPSIEEGLALSLLQAMAAGLAVVTTAAAGGAEAVRDGIDGFIVPAGDEAALSQALADLIDDPDRRRAMGAAGRARMAAEFGWDRYIDRALDAYRAVLAR